MFLNYIPSVRTSAKAEARRRVGYLTAITATSTMAIVLEEHADERPDRVVTASKLTAIYKAGLDEATARFIYRQDMLPEQGPLNRQRSEASADYYQ